MDDMDDIAGRTAAGRTCFLTVVDHRKTDTVSFRLACSPKGSSYPGEAVTLLTVTVSCDEDRDITRRVDETINASPDPGTLIGLLERTRKKRYTL